MAITTGTLSGLKFTKYGASMNAQNVASFINGTANITNAGTSAGAFFLYGLNFETLRQYLSQNLKITSFSMTITGGRYNSSLGSSHETSFNVVSDFGNAGSTSDLSAYTDVLGDNRVTVTKGSVPPTTVTEITHGDISSNFLTWVNNNLEDVLNGYTSDSFGFRFRMKAGQFRACVISVDYQYGFNEYKISTAVTPTGGGSVTGGGTYNEGSTATLTATPATGYKFKQWSDGNTSASRTVTVSADATYTATFELLTYTATFKNYDGTVLQTSTVSHGSTPSYTGATPTKPSTAQYTYTFSGWSPALTAITGDTTYTAQFTSTVRSYAITANAGAGGTVTGGGNYNYGSNATLTATANDGYKFKQWSDGNTSNPRTVSVTGAATYTAEFVSDGVNLIRVGTSKPSAIHVGTTKGKSVWIGTTKIFG